MEFVVSQWTGDDFGDIELQLSALAASLSQLSEQHMAYPILHYYHAANHQKANAVALAILYEALLIIKYGVPEKHHPAGTILKSARSSTETFLDTLHSAYISPSEEVPPLPNLQKLREKEVPTVADEVFKEKLDELKQRRNRLYGYIQNSAWQWPPIKEKQQK